LNPRVRDLFDLGGDVADLARPKRGDFHHLRPEDPDTIDFVDGVCGHHADARALFKRPVDHANKDDDAKISVVPGIDEERFKRSGLVALGRGQTPDDRLKHKVDIETRLGGDRHGVRGVDADHVLDLLPDPLGLRGGQVNLVEHGDDLMPSVESVIDIRQRLSLDPLARVDHQKRALACGQRPRHFVSEVNVTGRIHEVEDVRFPVLGFVFEAHRLRLDGDPALALYVHGIEHLLDHVALRHRPGLLDEPVGERRLAMVDMGDDREVSDILD
jgi:hypothetical protein